MSDTFILTLDEILDPVFNSMDDGIAWASWEDEVKQQLTQLIADIIGGVVTLNDSNKHLSVSDRGAMNLHAEEQRQRAKERGIDL